MIRPRTMHTFVPSALWAVTPPGNGSPIRHTKPGNVYRPIWGPKITPSYCPMRPIPPPSSRPWSGQPMAPGDNDAW
eukprot:scaffold21555_cov84-Amphora_coffeaeformis.AAC.1